MDSEKSTKFSKITRDKVRPHLILGTYMINLVEMLSSNKDRQFKRKKDIKAIQWFIKHYKEYMH